IRRTRASGTRAARRGRMRATTVARARRIGARPCVQPAGPWGRTRRPGTVPPGAAPALPCRAVAFWLFKFNQPRGFGAVRDETQDFTQLAGHVRISAQLGDQLVIYNIEGKHLVVVVRTTGPA